MGEHNVSEFKQGELEIPHDDRLIQGELFQSVHRLMLLSPHRPAVKPIEKAKQDELDLFPEIQQLF